MNHSIATADRNTHLKVAGLALFAAITIIVVGFTARVDNPATAMARAESNGPAIKAGKITQFSTRFASEIR